MNKFVRKAAAVMFAGAMLVQMSMGASAAKLTISGQGEGSIYAAYRLLNLETTLKSDGHDAHPEGKHTDSCYSYAYTVNSKYRSLLRSVIDPDDADGPTDGEIIGYIRDMDSEQIHEFSDALYKSFLEDAGTWVPDFSDFEAQADGKTFVSGSDVRQGYYLIRETKIGAAPDVRSLIMLDTMGQDDLTINTKEDIPDLTKKIFEDNKYVDAVDQAVGDTVHYQLKTTIPELSYRGFIHNTKPYNIQFYDTMSSGLSLDKDSVVLKVNGKSVNLAECDKDGELVSGDYAQVGGLCYEDIGAGGFAGVLHVYVQPLAFSDTTTDDIVVTVDYDCEITRDAVSGTAGNPNTAKLYFDNDPYNTKPSTSVTPEDKNTVFTYDVVVNKVDGAGASVKGANFKLQKKNDAGTYVDYRTNTFDANQTVFRFDDLDSGFYKLVESTVPDGYNGAADVEFEIRATYDKDSDDPKLTDLKVYIDGVEQGTDGPFVIDMTPGEVKTNIVNTSGKKLPSTGGAGTYAFYIGGGVLVLVGAGAMIMMQKRKKGSAE
ncbi:MAG: isopeptide-forming domain-containing fimbrial protein [Clostridia bacterium]|nr:isopeptide-forming domain-containing fimbrial protein [Clostridia bacterium]